MSKKKYKPELYNDLHPKTSLKGTGFKNKKVAIDTIKLISLRSLKYQFDVINTMYNRAKYHPNKTKDMDEAMIVFSKWLKNYKNKKKDEDSKYPWLKLEIIKKLKNLPFELQLELDNKDLMFMYNFVKGKSYKLQYIPIDKLKPSGMDYWSYRLYFIKKKLNNIIKNNTPLYYTKGKYKNLPTKQHLDLIFHAYSPDNKIYQL